MPDRDPPSAFARWARSRPFTGGDDEDRLSASDRAAMRQAGFPRPADVRGAPGLRRYARLALRPGQRVLDAARGAALDSRAAGLRSLGDRAGWAGSSEDAAIFVVAAAGVLALGVLVGSFVGRWWRGRRAAKGLEALSAGPGRTG